MTAEIGTTNSGLNWRLSTVTVELATRTLMTLGPEGTSSDQAAHKMRQRQHACGVRLFDSYEKAAEAVVAAKAGAALLVANAYHHINRFYIANELMPVAAFFFDTPNYVIATRNVAQFHKIQRPRIATHPAPAHRISSLLIQDDFERSVADSTSAAARAVYTGDADACLTTDIACRKYGLYPASKPFLIPMLWAIFISVSEKPGAN